MLIRRDKRYGGNDLSMLYRPGKLSEVIGNDLVVKTLSNYINNGTLPHSLLLYGPAGCGKTTMARIIALSLNCTSTDGPTVEPCMICPSCEAILDSCAFDVAEINVGKDSGKADVEKAVANLSMGALNSRFKVIIFDEAHALTPAAKDSLLKVLEDSYAHVYIVLCTNKPEKLKIGTEDDNPFVDRNTLFKFGKLNDTEILSLVDNVAQFEGHVVAEDCIKYLAESGKGNPRNALNNLSKAIAEGSWDLSNIKKLLGDASYVSDDPQVMALSRLIIGRKGWLVVSPELVRLLKLHGPESLRIAIAGFITGCIKRERNHNNILLLADCITTLTEPLMFDKSTSTHKLTAMLAKVSQLISKDYISK